MNFNNWSFSKATLEVHIYDTKKKSICKLEKLGCMLKDGVLLYMLTDLLKETKTVINLMIKDASNHYRILDYHHKIISIF